jgi:hypothetical protein
LLSREGVEAVHGTATDEDTVSLVRRLIPLVCLPLAQIRSESDLGRAA